jgi:hypothetical protein
VSSNGTIFALFSVSLAHASPVVRDCTPTVLSAGSLVDLMAESFLTASDWFELMYGSEKSTSCRRSSVIVMAEATMSNLPPAFSCGMRVSNFSDLNSLVRPISLATAATRSTSKPSAVVPFMVSNGGNAVSEPTVSLPGVTSFGLAAGCVVSPPDVFVPDDGVWFCWPEHPAMATANASTTISTSHLLALRIISSSDDVTTFPPSAATNATAHSTA